MLLLHGFEDTFEPETRCLYDWLRPSYLKYFTIYLQSICLNTPILLARCFRPHNRAQTAKAGYSAC